MVMCIGRLHNYGDVWIDRLHNYGDVYRQVTQLW
jgi:hypothetical protein